MSHNEAMLWAMFFLGLAGGVGISWLILVIYVAVKRIKVQP